MNKLRVYQRSGRGGSEHGIDSVKISYHFGTGDNLH